MCIMIAIVCRRKWEEDKEHLDANETKHTLGADAFPARVAFSALGELLDFLHHRPNRGFAYFHLSVMSTQYEVALYGDFFAKDFRPILNRLSLHCDSSKLSALF